MTVLATRGSPLASWQASQVADAIAARATAKRPELLLVRTTGDEVQDRAIIEIGNTSVFTAEVDRAVLDGRAHAGVHSLKDLATKLEHGLVLGAVLPRGPAEDVLVSTRHAGLASLPQGARIATGSLRRRAMLLSARPDLVCVDMRGNVGTRLEKLAAGEADALVMARAGLERLGLAHWITEILPIDRFLPAAGQGLIGVTCRISDAATTGMLLSIRDAAGFSAALAERALLAGLRAGCHAPVGAYAVVVRDDLVLRGRVLAKDGTCVVEGETGGRAVDAVRIGEELARRLLADGASRLLEG